MLPHDLPLLAHRLEDFRYLAQGWCLGSWPTTRCTQALRQAQGREAAPLPPWRSQPLSEDHGKIVPNCVTDAGTMIKETASGTSKNSPWACCWRTGSSRLIPVPILDGVRNRCCRTWPVSARLRSMIWADGALRRIAPINPDRRAAGLWLVAVRCQQTPNPASASALRKRLPTAADEPVNYVPGRRIIHILCETDRNLDLHLNARASCFGDWCILPF